ncbi:MAG TPA: dienelactone hydrolase family protein [Candidatus Cybelea sp.]|nr:dienelactone hydrolase family protein [Candidatus Cybelea sp.]
MSSLVARFQMLSRTIGALNTGATKKFGRVSKSEFPMAMSRQGKVRNAPTDARRTVLIPPLMLEGNLDLPGDATGVVLFAHGSGSSRFSPRNRYVAAALCRAGFGTLLFDLLTEDEATDRARVFDIPLLAERLGTAVEWLATQPDTCRLPLGLFGASTGAAAALVMAAESPRQVGAVVSRGGRPDLAGAALRKVRAPTLLIVGGDDPEVLELNRTARAELHCISELRIVLGATHLFEEAGKLDIVIDLAQAWFGAHLSAGRKG